MVFYPPGFRPGATREDPTDGMPSMPGTYTCHGLAIDKTGRKILVRENDVALPVRRTIQQQAVQNYTSSAWCRQADSNFDVLLVGSPVHTMEMIYLHCYAFNGNAVGGTSIRMLHASTIIDRQDVQLNGSFTDETVYGNQMYQDYNDWLNDDFERIGRAPYMNGETGSMVTNSGNAFATYTMWDESNNAIAPQTSMELFIPLINVLTQTAPWLPRKLVDPRIRVYGLLNPVCSTNAAPDLATPALQFNGMETLIEGLLYDPTTRMAISSYYARAPMLHRCIVHDRFIKDMGTFVTGTYMGDAQLTPLTGQYASMNIWFNRQDPNVTREFLLYGANRPAAAGTKNPLTVDLMSFNDSSGYPIYYPDYRANFIRYSNNGQTLNCLMRQFKAYYMHYFCFDPKKTLLSGLSTGGLAMDGSYIIRAQLSTSNTQGTTTGVTMVVDARRYGIITITDTFVLVKL